MSAQRPQLDPETRAALLAHARAAVLAAARGDRLPAAPHALEARPDLRAHAGCFVTLHTAAGDLRGCIGTFSSDGALPEVIARMARQAAVHDPRFDPVGPEEVPGLVLEISVLTPPEPFGGDPAALEIGRHGLQIERGMYRGVLLPQVATEQRWDARRFLDEVCRKAGLRPGAWREPDARVWTFEALVFGEGHA